MYHPHFYPRYSRGPSRLLWFFIGAGTAFWWLKHREANGHVPFCARHRLQPPTTDNQQNPGWPQRMGDIPRAINNIPPVDATTEPSPQPPSRGSPASWKWDPDREHLEKISKQAVDAVGFLRILLHKATSLFSLQQMADLTESTLESVLSTAESLKVVCHSFVNIIFFSLIMNLETC